MVTEAGDGNEEIQHGLVVGLVGEGQDGPASEHLEIAAVSFLIF